MQKGNQKTTFLNHLQNHSPKVKYRTTTKKFPINNNLNEIAGNKTSVITVPGFMRMYEAMNCYVLKLVSISSVGGLPRSNWSCRDIKEETWVPDKKP